LGVRSLYLRTPMTFEIFSSLKSNIIRWPRHLVMVGGLCLLAACGGGGGSTTGASGGAAPNPVLALISSAVYVNGKPAELLPTYSAGSGSITCKDSSTGTVVKQVANAVSGIPVSFTLTASVDCKLTVLYQDPNTVRTSLLPAESPIRLQRSSRISMLRLSTRVDQCRCLQRSPRLRISMKLFINVRWKNPWLVASEFA